MRHIFACRADHGGPAAIEHSRPLDVAAILLAIAVLLGSSAGAMAAQPPPAQAETLRAEVDARFDLLPLTEGFVLRPRSSSSGIRAIEIADGSIAVDGTRISGAELRERLGEADADLVLRLSYLDAEGRERLLGTSSPAPSVQQEPERRRSRGLSRRSRRGDRIRLGGGISVGPEEVVTGDVVAFGGSVDVRGQVQGDVVSIGGSVTLGPTAEVSRDVTAIAGTVRRDPGAQIGGRVREVGMGALENADWRWPQMNIPSWWGGWRLGSAFALMSTLVRLGVLALLASLIVLLAGPHVGVVASRVATESLKAGAVGLLSQLLFVPLTIVVVVILFVTIVGWPLLLLLPFVMLGMCVIALVGFTAVSYQVGRLLSARAGWMALGPYATTMAGLVAIVGPMLLSRLIGLIGGPFSVMSTGLGTVGFFMEYAAWTIGFGAMALARFGRPTFRADSPVPTPA